jgi:hypothetical protein
MPVQIAIAATVVLLFAVLVTCYCLSNGAAWRHRAQTVCVHCLRPFQRALGGGSGSDRKSLQSSNNRVWFFYVFFQQLY